MKSIVATSFILAAALSSAASTPLWQTIDAYADGQIEPHSLVIPLANDRNAAKAIENFDYDKSPYYLDLNGQWKFKWVKGVDNRPVGFQNDSSDTDSWQNINVPGNWERQGFGTAVYVNTTYEFDSEWAGFEKNWPLVPVETNEVGSYKRSFTIPASWDGRRIVLCLEGVISFYYAWVNGQYIGCNMDSKTAAEFDITDKVRPGENTIALEVYRWSAGSYFECQDFWRISGIERDVYLYSTPPTYIADYTVRPGLDSAYKDGILDIDLKIGGFDKSKAGSLSYTLLNSDGLCVSQGSAICSEKLSLHDTIPEVKAWSAEHPNLYTLLLNLKNKQGETIETTGCLTGFKTTEIKDGVFLLNGKAIKIKGVNRHAHSQMGRTVPRDTALLDVKLMKANNINAVRNCHYPQDRYWYYLCDRYGLYLCDEANAESHGYGYEEQSLAKKPEWTNAIINRVNRMWNKSKNSASVTFYSLGNECGNGIVFEEAYKWLKAIEPTRPVQYERALDDFNSDIFAYMYAPHDYVKAYAEDSTRTRPYIQCEYAHAMGNSVGGLEDYWKIFEAYPKLGGGFIWDWVDQSFVEHDNNGRAYFAYGGEYGPENIPSDNSFLCNGLITSVRTAHPALAEVRKVYQYIKCKLVDPETLAIEVNNRMDFTNLDEYVLNWSLTAPDGKVICGGTKHISCEPHRSLIFSIGDNLIPSDLTEAYLDLSWISTKESPLIPAGSEVAYDQFVIPMEPASEDCTIAKLKSKGNSYKAGDVEFKLNDRGGIESLTKGGVRYFDPQLSLSLYRPATENDDAWGGEAPLWREAGLDSLQQIAIGKPKIENNIVKVETTIVGRSGQHVGEATFKYWVNTDGSVNVNCDFMADTAVVKSMARVGLTFGMDANDIKDITYLGRSGESYADRNAAGRIGLWTVTPADDFHLYVKPGAAGNHTDTRWLRLNGTDAMTISSDKAFEFSVYPYADSNIDNARHTNDLTPGKTLTVHIDEVQDGVGTATCGPGVLGQYRVPVSRHTFTFKFTL